MGLEAPTGPTASRSRPVRDLRYFAYMSRYLVRAHRQPTTSPEEAFTPSVVIQLWAFATVRCVGSVLANFVAPVTITLSKIPLHARNLLVNGGDGYRRPPKRR